jgi:GMP synthase (glutamine-hydrolysing)
VSAPRLLVVQNADDDPLGPVGDWLTEAGVELDVRNLESGATLPDDLTGYAGLLVLGGSASAVDDARAPWLPAVRGLLRDAVAGEVPTLGICLGGQLLAVANGGTVRPNPDGPEFGAQLIAKRAAAGTDPLFGPLPITPDVVQWHFDAITALPPGAIVLAGSPMCDVQAFRLGRLAWGVQFHIETTPALVRQWAASDSAALEGYDVEQILSRTDAVHADLAEVWQPFVAAFADIVRSPATVPRAGGVPTSSAGPITDPAAIRAALAAEANAARSHSALPMPGLRPQGHD